MRTRGAVEDLVVVDLDDPDEVESRGPGAQRRHFEDHYAELPFGLGTVPRRLEHDPWYSRPGVLLWIAIALVGLLALAGSDDGTSSDRAAPVAHMEPGAYPPQLVMTSTQLALYHVGRWTELDVDRKELRPIRRSGLPPALATLAAHTTDLGGLASVPIRTPDTFEGRLVCLSSASATLTARLAEPGACAPPERGTADLGSHSARSRSGRFVFLVSGPDLLVIDALDGLIRRVDIELPPFESLFIL